MVIGFDYASILLIQIINFMRSSTFGEIVCYEYVIVCYGYVWWQTISFYSDIHTYWWL